MTTLAEKYRPQSLEDLAGFDETKQRLGRVLARGAGGRAFWFSGASGTGKTTLARIVARGVAHPSLGVEEVDAGGLSASDIDGIAGRFAGRNMFEPGGWALIVNESHGLRRDTIRRLLVWLEELPEWATVVFTTTTQGQLSLFESKDDAGPLVSRCLEFTLDPKRECSNFALHLERVAKAEGIPATLDALKCLVASKSYNLRACMMALEAL